VVNRAIGYTLAGLVSAAVAHEQNRTAMLFGVGMGVAIGAISACAYRVRSSQSTHSTGRLAR
jgi:hypothetical protein